MAFWIRFKVSGLVFYLFWGVQVGNEGLGFKALGFNGLGLSD